VVFVLQSISSTGVTRIRKSVRGDDDAAIVPAVEAGVVAGTEAEMGFGTHGCWRQEGAVIRGRGGL
jgi:hypothetical protein